jgi:amidohydrolase
MCEAGVLKDPDVDAIMGFHCYPASRLNIGEIGVCTGPAMAGSAYFTIRIIGKGAHASAPRLSRDPIYIGCQLVNAMQSIVARSTNPLHSLVISATKFHAGSARNAIPEEAVIEGTIRALFSELLEEAEEKIKNISRHIAAAFDANVKVKVNRSCPVLVNDRQYVSFLSKVCKKIGILDNLKSNFAPMMAAEDFAFYAEKVPAVFWFLGLRAFGSDNYPGLHNKCFDFNNDAIELAIRANCEAACWFFSKTCNGM